MTTGVSLSAYTLPLHKVAEEYNEQPWLSFDVGAAVGEKTVAHIVDQWGDATDLRKRVASLDLPYLGELTFDELCKIKHSSIFMMDRSVTDLFENDSPQHMIIHKITNSIWRWDMTRDTWNNVVDAYNGIRSFDLGLDGFQVTLDHTTGFNECGYALHSRTFLDGVFAFLVHYRGEHVMTIGFSVLADKQIAIQQIQLAKRTGNRFLFKFPQNRVEYVISRFREAFPHHRLFIVDGASVATKSLRQYQNGLEYAEAEIAKYARRNDLEDYAIRHLGKLRSDVVVYSEKIAHLTDEVERLRAFYANSGRYAQGEMYQRHGLTHYEVTETAIAVAA